MSEKFDLSREDLRLFLDALGRYVEFYEGKKKPAIYGDFVENLKDKYWSLYLLWTSRR